MPSRRTCRHASSTICATRSRRSPARPTLTPARRVTYSRECGYVGDVVRHSDGAVHSQRKRAARHRAGRPGAYGRVAAHRPGSRCRDLARPELFKAATACRSASWRYLAVASPQFVKRHFNAGVDTTSLSRAPSLRFNPKDRLQAIWMRRLCRREIQARRPIELPSTQAFVDQHCPRGLGNESSLVDPPAPEIRRTRRARC